MDIDELKDKAPIFSSLLCSNEDVEYTAIEDYVFSTLGKDKSQIENPELFYTNFIHLMCHLQKDIEEIETHLKDYRARYDALQNVKRNQAEFERRKLIYFCDLNKAALGEINSFIASGIPQFLSDHSYDTLKRECKKDGLSDLHYKSRYKFAWHRDYYSIDYPFAAVVKINQYTKEKCQFGKAIEEEQRLIKIFKNEPDKFWDIMDRYVDNDHVMQKILERVSNDYNLYKRKELFETLSGLFIDGKYQSFITLGIIQIEGLFDDYCSIHYGKAENQGTLIEKAQKTLKTNEYDLFRMYPYFAFDIPLLRNEVAHKGMLKTEDAKRIAYNLVLDLNTLSQMVKSESFNKFIYAIMTHEELIKWEPQNDGDTDELYDKLLYELLMFDQMANAHFWRVLRNPEEYEDEIEFYRQDDIPEGYIDLPGIITVLSRLMYSEGLWKAMHRLLDKHITPTSKWIEAEEFARRMKNEYIAVLEDGAKAECIEVAKIVG